MDSSRTTSCSAEAIGHPFRAASLLLIAFTALFPIAMATAQNSALRQPGSASIEGTVRNSEGAPVEGATVSLESNAGVTTAEVTTDLKGRYAIASCPAGEYSVRARKPGLAGAAKTSITLSPNEKKQIDLLLGSADTGRVKSPNPNASSGSAAETMQFDDEPKFRVAGVTDWSNFGLHGSDTRERTSEALAKETIALQPGAPEALASGAPGSGRSAGVTDQTEENLRAALIRDPASFQTNHQLGEFYLRAKRYEEAIPLLQAAYRIKPDDQANIYDLALAYKAKGDLLHSREQVQKMLAIAENADALRLLGNLEEHLGDPIAAEREYQRAVQLDPSEQNYFEWGAELLLHKADRPAAEVFGKGFVKHPQSSRLLMGLGVALYASGAYDEAERSLCEASDLNTTDPNPYLFVGKIEKATVAVLPCGERVLERFARLQPENALASYYYAVALWKKTRGVENSEISKHAQALLEKAVALDPKLSGAYLQLGVLYFDHGNFDQAIQAYRKAIEIAPGVAEAHHRLALAYKRIGDQSSAQQEFQAYEQAEKSDAAALEKQRRELQEFIIILDARPQESAPR
ncbi:MAG TPA: tetratricopeptide repeat protein [Terriglobales bacterium]|nr:tetratricopeptide repeat protein [Terriglobales bacterium]